MSDAARLRHIGRTSSLPLNEEIRRLLRAAALPDYVSQRPQHDAVMHTQHATVEALRALWALSSEEDNNKKDTPVSLWAVYFASLESSSSFGFSGYPTSFLQALACIRSVGAGQHCSDLSTRLCVLQRIVRVPQWSEFVRLVDLRYASADKDASDETMQRLQKRRATEQVLEAQRRVAREIQQQQQPQQQGATAQTSATPMSVVAKAVQLQQEQEDETTQEGMSALDGGIVYALEHASLLVRCDALQTLVFLYFNFAATATTLMHGSPSHSTVLTSSHVHVFTKQCFSLAMDLAHAAAEVTARVEAYRALQRLASRYGALLASCSSSSQLCHPLLLGSSGGELPQLGEWLQQVLGALSDVSSRHVRHTALLATGSLLAAAATEALVFRGSERSLESVCVAGIASMVSHVAEAQPGDRPAVAAALQTLAGFWRDAVSALLVAKTPALLLLRASRAVLGTPIMSSVEATLTRRLLQSQTTASAAAKASEQQFVASIRSAFTKEIESLDSLLAKVDASAQQPETTKGGNQPTTTTTAAQTFSLFASSLCELVSSNAREQQQQGESPAQRQALQLVKQLKGRHNLLHEAACCLLSLAPADVSASASSSSCETALRLKNVAQLVKFQDSSLASTSRFLGALGNALDAAHGVAASNGNLAVTTSSSSSAKRPRSAEEVVEAHQQQRSESSALLGFLQEQLAGLRATTTSLVLVEDTLVTWGCTALPPGGKSKTTPASASLLPPIVQSSVDLSAVASPAFRNGTCGLAFGGNSSGGSLELTCRFASRSFFATPHTLKLHEMSLVVFMAWKQSGNSATTTTVLQQLDALLAKRSEIHDDDSSLTVVSPKEDATLVVAGLFSPSLACTRGGDTVTLHRPYCATAVLADFAIPSPRQVHERAKVDSQKSSYHACLVWRPATSQRREASSSSSGRCLVPISRLTEVVI